MVQGSGVQVSSFRFEGCRVLGFVFRVAQCWLGGVELRPDFSSSRLGFEFGAENLEFR